MVLTNPTELNIQSLSPTPLTTRKPSHVFDPPSLLPPHNFPSPEPIPFSRNELQQ